MKQDRKMVLTGAAALSVAQTFPPRGKSAANPWRPRFSPTRGPPHRRHGFAATKIRATRFASSLPQDLSSQLMFDLGEIPAARLKPFPWFGILRRPVRRSRGAPS
jgi:hypothetical protein